MFVAPAAVAICAQRVNFCICVFWACFVEARWCGKWSRRVRPKWNQRILLGQDDSIEEDC